jgi:F5/8 type C domain
MNRRTKKATVIAGLVSMAALFSHCRTVQDRSAAKDVNLSPRDVSRNSAVIWLESDGTVHNAACPAGATDVTRSCPGLVDTITPIALKDYTERLEGAIVNTRPGASGAPIMPNSALATALDAKIKRLNDKMATGTYSAADVSTFQSQLVALNAELATARITLTTEESKDRDTILDAMKAGKDATLDDGERFFALAVAPFNGAGVAGSKGFRVYRLVLLKGSTSSSQCSRTSTMNQLQYQIGGKFESLTVVSITSPTQLTGTIGSLPFILTSSSAYASGNGNRLENVVTIGGGSNGWAPLSYLDGSGNATSLQYVQIDFNTSKVVTGLSFAFASSAACMLTSFRVEGSQDGVTFAPIQKAEWNGLARLKTYHSSFNGKNFHSHECGQNHSFFFVGVCHAPGADSEM